MLDELVEGFEMIWALPRKSDFSTQGIFLKSILILFHVFVQAAFLKNREFLSDH